MYLISHAFFFTTEIRNSFCSLQYTVYILHISNPSASAQGMFDRQLCIVHLAIANSWRRIRVLPYKTLIIYLVCLAVYPPKAADSNVWGSQYFDNEAPYNCRIWHNVPSMGCTYCTAVVLPSRKCGHTYLTRKSDQDVAYICTKSARPPVKIVDDVLMTLSKHFISRCAAALFPFRFYPRNTWAVGRAFAE